VNRSNTRISLDLESVAVNNRTMGVSILYQGQTWHWPTLPEGLFTWSHDIELPAKITLIFGGRSGTTTLVDEHNNIVKNMSVRINTVKFDGLPLWNLWTEHCVITELDDSDDVIIGATVCANGRVDLVFDHTTVFECVASSKLQ
jgi:hypothetical protein